MIGRDGVLEPVSFYNLYGRDKMSLQKVSLQRFLFNVCIFYGQRNMYISLNYTELLRLAWTELESMRLEDGACSVPRLASVRTRLASYGWLLPSHRRDLSGWRCSAVPSVCRRAVCGRWRSEVRRHANKMKHWRLRGMLAYVVAASRLS